MPYTAAELDSIFNAALDFYIKQGSVMSLNIQERPLLRILGANDKSFSGGKENLSIRVKGTYGNAGVNDSMAGYTHDDTVEFYTPKNIREAKFPWREHHIGIVLTETDLKKDGISVTDENGAETSEHAGRDKHVLAGIFQTALDDLSERKADSENALAWGDGTADASAMAGIRSIVVDNPLAGTVGGIDAALAANSWWRNRARTAAYATAYGASEGPQGGDAVTSSPTNGGVLCQVLQKEYRQLMRYGGFRRGFALAGSDFIDALETEMRANGYYSDRGFTGRQDAAMGDVYFKGMKIEYDPTLDSDGDAKRAYFIDSAAIMRYWMTGERNRKRSPARPTNQFVLHRSITDTGQMICNRRDSSLVIDIT